MKCVLTELGASAQKGLFRRGDVIKEKLKLSRVLRRNPRGKSDSKLEHIPAFLMREKGN